MNTYVKPSKIEGLGLFAKEDIAAGEEILQGPMDLNDQRFMDEWIAYLKTGHKSKNYPEGFCMINHSKTPNTSRGGELCIIASVPIMKGEEITEDYYSLPDIQNPFVGGVVFAPLDR